MEATMIFAKDYRKVLEELGKEYFVFDIQYMDDLKSWSKTEGPELSEPSQLMKLIAGEGDKLIMVIQEGIPEEMMRDNMKGLGVRWALKSTALDPEKILNSTKKKLAFFFIKECARTAKDVGGNVMIEDEWSVKEMEKLGFFNE
jgi:hypothetical protein